MSLSEEPARKVLVKHCSDLIESNSSDSSRHRKWTFVNKEKSVSLRLIWIQGIIINVSESYDITLDDGSGIAFIYVKDAAGFGPWIKKGQYVMVIGEMYSTNPDVKIKAVKLTHLVEPNAEILWVLEILDFWNYLDAR